MPQNDQWEDIGPAKAATAGSSAAGSGDQWEDIAPPIQPPATQPPAQEQPGFFARASERLLGTQHPVDQAVSEAKQLYNAPGQTLLDATKQAAHILTIDMPNALVHPVKATGGPEFAQDIANRNYRGAMGTLAGDVLPMVIASPEVRGAVAEAPATIGEAASRVPEATARALRTENGTLRPSVRGLARAGGAAAGTAIGGTPGGVVGALSGPSIVDAITPDRAPTTEQLTAQAIREGRAAKLPVRMPRAVMAGPAEQPRFGGTPTSPAAMAAIPERQLPPASAAPAAAVAPPNVRFVSQFEKPKAPAPSIIAGPDSPPPPTKVTYQSYPRETLVQMAQKGDVNAVRELQRNPADYDLPPNARYLIEPGSPSQPFRNYTQAGTLEKPSVIPAPGAYSAPKEVIRFPQEEATGASVAAPDVEPEQAPRVAAPPAVLAKSVRAPRAKAVPAAQRFAPDILDEAEGQMRGALDVSDSLPAAGRYFDEYTAEDHPLTQYQDIAAGERAAGKWRGVQSQKGNVAAQYPWFNDPEISTSKLRTALQQGKGAMYERIVGRIAEGIAKERATASEAISDDIPTLRDLAQRVGPIDSQLAQHLTDLADGKTALAPEALKAYVKERIADANTAAAFSEAIDELSASTAESRASEAHQATDSPRSKADETELDEPRERPR
jgi:hypothetical protein